MENLKFKKIYAVIPLELWIQLANSGKFNNDFDSWIAQLISDALEDENENR
ncbi:MAG: hypothetical protein HYT70_03655 [Candidatus Aenigmarchaeota archaeon]|nr:hypothetical protein [Candidatus Aenigmarchaeota archaeon]